MKFIRLGWATTRLCILCWLSSFWPGPSSCVTLVEIVVGDVVSRGDDVEEEVMEVGKEEEVDEADEEEEEEEDAEEVDKVDEDKDDKGADVDDDDDDDDWPLLIDDDSQKDSFLPSMVTRVTSTLPQCVL